MSNSPSKSAVVPIHTKVSAELQTLYDLVAEQSLPLDEPDHHSFLSAIELSESAKSYERFNTLVEHFIKQTKGNRGPKQLTKLRKHWEYVLLNLSRAIFMRRWLLVALDTHAYSKDYWLKHFGLSYAYTKDVIDYLHAEELIELKKGALFANQPTRTRIFPTADLRAMLWQLFLDTEQPIEPPYVYIKDPEEDYKDIAFSLPDDHPDVAGLIKINEFLKCHQWACKGPIRLPFKYNPFSSGRLITPFQALPDKKVRLRINTLIDGQRICEVDFNANHLRLNLAALAGEDAADTPYEDILELADLKSGNREHVKSFITIGMGSADRKKAIGACRSMGVNDFDFEKLEDAALRRFPKLQLFCGFGIHAQCLEGQILKQVILEGVDKDIVALPVHDAIAVIQGNEEWAEEAMLRAWNEHANKEGGNARARVKVDRPEKP